MFGFIKTGLMFLGGITAIKPVLRNVLTAAGLGPSYPPLRPPFSEKMVLEQVVIFDSHEDAESALKTMKEIIDKFGSVSVGDIYDIVGQTPPRYLYDRYGWTTLKGTKIIPYQGGYKIELSRLVRLGDSVTKKLAKFCKSRGGSK